CGIGGGSDEQEFNILDLDFATRIERVWETLDTCRRGWAGAGLDGSETEYTASAFSIVPAPAPGELPFWYGGITNKSVVRAVERAVAGLPRRRPVDRVTAKVEHCRPLPAEATERATCTIAAVPQTGIAPTAAEALAKFDLDGVMHEAMRAPAIHGY